MPDRIILPQPKAAPDPEPEPEQEAPPRLPVAPATLHFKSGKTFVIPGVDQWAAEDDGIYAQGHFSGAGSKKERHIIVPTSTIEFIEIDWDGLRAHLDAQQEEGSDDA